MPACLYSNSSTGCLRVAEMFIVETLYGKPVATDESQLAW